MHWLNESNRSRESHASNAPRHNADRDARRLIELSLAENTRIAYRKGWRRFADFCAARGYAPLPAAPQAVVEFIVAHAAPAAGKSLSLGTVELCCNAINHKHVEAGLARPGRDPRVADVLRGLRRLNGARTRRVRALREHHIQAMLEACGRAPCLLGVRDAAVIALGFAGALRRSEICNLKIDDAQIVEAPGGAPNPARRSTPAGLLLHIRRSKTDPQARGQTIAIPEGRAIRPLQRIDDWLDASGLRAAPGSGHLFRTMRRGGKLTGNPLHPTDVARIVKHYAARIGLDPRDIAGHSLRAGFVTSAAAHNARLDKIMEVTRHRHPATVLKYIRDTDAFCHHAGAKFL